MATQYLWSAVEKGNLKAEITLANLFAPWNGLAKNCAQARVLLRAAAEKGNAEASNQLVHVIKTGLKKIVFSRRTS
jgi:TPR repeat protein